MIFTSSMAAPDDPVELLVPTKLIRWSPEGNRVEYDRQKALTQRPVSVVRTRVVRFSGIVSIFNSLENKTDHYHALHNDNKLLIADCLSLLSNSFEAGKCLTKWRQIFQFTENNTSQIGFYDLLSVYNKLGLNWNVYNEQHKSLHHCRFIIGLPSAKLDQH